MVTLEQVEKLMQETGADFYLVSWALKSTDGDEAKAKEYIRQNREEKSTAYEAADGESAQAESNDAKTEEPTQKKSIPDVEDLLKTIRGVLDKVNATNILIRKEGDVLLNISCTIGAIGLILAPIAALVGLGAAVLTSYDVVIVLEDGREINLMAMAKDEVNNVKKGWEHYTEARREGKSGKTYTAEYEEKTEKAEDPFPEPDAPTGDHEDIHY